jgi:chromate transporter
MSAPDIGALFSHCLAMSMLAVGGAVAVAPELHRSLVLERGWLSEAQFSASIALAQAAPGPNLLFVPVLGYTAAGLPGALAALAGILIPSTTVALAATRWGFKRREHRGVRAFMAGMAPVTLGLLAATALVLMRPQAGSVWAWMLAIGTAALTLRTKINPVWLIAVGAGVGAFGGV